MAEPHLQFILLWLFWRRDFWNNLPRMVSNWDLSDLASQIARITNMSHQHLATANNINTN
jgi:hypothetical protein